MNGGSDYGYYGPPRGGGSGAGRAARVRLFAGVAAVAFVVTLAVVVGQRLSEQAVAVLAGAVCGVGASIPTSLLIAWVTRRRQEPRREQGPYPPVVIVQQPHQGAGPALPHAAYAPPYPYPAGPREFTVVGEVSDEDGY